jgi:hypothetical protein
MERLFKLALAVVLVPGSAFASVFESFAALSEGKDCRIVLDFPKGEFCG